MCNHDHKNHKPGTNHNKAAHEKEHATWNRRSFIQALGLAGAGSIMVGHAAVTASQPSPLSVALANAENDNILVIIRLKGGNDGLNTIVPIYDYDNYANLRPTIKHNEANLINLNADFGVPNYMTEIESLWGDGKMKVVHGVGYDNQNLSHFTSSDIWASTQPNGFESTGWWGRYFEDLYPDYLISPPDTPPAVQIGSIGNLIFEGSDNNYAFSVANPDQLANVAENGTLHDVLDIPECVYGDKLLFMRSTANTTFVYSQVIHQAYLAANNSVEYGDGSLASQLAIVSRMIKGGLGTKVYMVTLDGFDNHANQVEDHQELLQDISKSMKDFYDDLASTGMDNEVLSMTISEFGRRPYENGSNGTDHGAASPVLLFGSGLQGNGFAGEHPNINVWDNNDNLIPSTDFRDIYSTILTDWFCLDPTVVDGILLNQTYENLDLGFSCNSLGISEFNNTSYLKHIPVYNGSQTSIEITMPATANVDIRLYDLMGKEIAVLANEILFAGKHKIDVKSKIKSRVSYGQYIYRISTGGQFYSKSIIIR